MTMTMMARVVAVENAFCAFSKDLVGAFCASTGPAASTRRVSSPPPDAGRLHTVPTLVESSQTHRTEMQVPDPIINGLETNGFTDQYPADGQLARVPRDGAGRTNTSNFIMPGVNDRFESAWQRPSRGHVEPRGGLLPERLVRPLLVVDPTKPTEAPLLARQIRGRGPRRVGFERAVHALMRPVLG